VSELPYPKEVIASALQHLIKRPTKVGLDALKVGYLSLADFQPLTTAERDALSVMRDPKRLPPDRLIESGALETFQALLAKCEVERKQLAGTLQLLESAKD